MTCLHSRQRVKLPTPPDYFREVLGLYRERSGDGSFGSGKTLNAGAFSIQRLEGSRGGIPELWVLNAAEMAKDTGRRESIDSGLCIWGGQEGFGRPSVNSADYLGTRVALAV